MLKKAPKQQRSEQMVTCILAGATRVFDTNTFAQATTNRIAEVAGVSIGSLYQYFSSKDAIALCLARQHLNETVEILRNARSSSRGYPIEERMRMSFVEILRDHRSRRMLHLNLVELISRNIIPVSALQDDVDLIVDEIASLLVEERSDVPIDEIRVCATLRHQSATVLVHAALASPSFSRDSVVIDYFDALTTATLLHLDLGRRNGTGRAQRCRESPVSSRH